MVACRRSGPTRLAGGVARSAYVHPRVVDAFLAGDELPGEPGEPDVAAWEDALLEFLADE